VGVRSLFHRPVKAAVQVVVPLVLRPPIVPDYTSVDPAVEKVSQLYAAEGFTGPYSRIRFWLAPLRQLNRLVPKQGRIIDLGCGEGILTNYLAVAEPGREVWGVELNEGRVKFADRGLPNARFTHANVLKQDLEPADAIVMSHMMHHLGSYNEQLVLIKRCYDLLRPGGKLIVAEVDRQKSFKYVVGWLNDVICVPILFEGTLYNPRIFHRSRQEWNRIFQEFGFTVDSIEIPGGGPFPDILIAATKPTEPIADYTDFTKEPVATPA
jgi:2-polyprenyl-3-methyl-5-hydroxy-6-metoxy-1,4-benzoquinol methylase